MTDTPTACAPKRHPVVVAHDLRRSQDFQLKIADAVTAFAGSMIFVYRHVVGFAG